MNYGKLCVCLGLLFATFAIRAEQPADFGLGRAIKDEELALLDIDVRPDGSGLPEGQGSVSEGQGVYEAKCLACHGEKGQGGPNDVLAGRDVKRTIGNHWPYATTLYDYIRRAMPYDSPGSLTNNEVYSLSAYLLYLNGILPADSLLTAEQLRHVVMPARSLFTPDERKGGVEIK